jgi:sulfate transport system ATP-binding protein
VTHDQEEALEVADRVVVMNKAKIEQVGTPEEVFHKPASQFVMEFLGQVNIFRCRVREGTASLGGLTFEYPNYQDSSERDATIYMRPHELEIRRHQENQPGLAATVVRLNPAGAFARVFLSADGADEIQVELPQDQYRDLSLSLGELVFVYPKNARVFIPDFVI